MKRNWKSFFSLMVNEIYNDLLFQLGHFLIAYQLIANSYDWFSGIIPSMLSLSYLPAYLLLWIGAYNICGESPGNPSRTIWINSRGYDVYNYGTTTKITKHGALGAVAIAIAYIKYLFTSFAKLCKWIFVYSSVFSKTNDTNAIIEKAEGNNEEITISDKADTIFLRLFTYLLYSVILIGKWISSKFIKSYDTGQHTKELFTNKIERAACLFLLSVLLMLPCINATNLIVAGLGSSCTIRISMTDYRVYQHSNYCEHIFDFYVKGLFGRSVSIRGDVVFEINNEEISAELLPDIDDPTSYSCAFTVNGTNSSLSKDLTKLIESGDLDCYIKIKRIRYSITKSEFALVELNYDMRLFSKGVRSKVKMDVRSGR